MSDLGASTTGEQDKAEVSRRRSPSRRRRRRTRAGASFATSSTSARLSSASRRALFRGPCGAQARRQRRKAPTRRVSSGSRRVWRIGSSVRGATWSGRTVTRCFAMQSSSCGHGRGSWQGRRLRRGLLASRIFKASSERRYDQSTNANKVAGASGTVPTPHRRMRESRSAASRSRPGERPERRTMSTQQANDLHDRPIGEVAAALTRDLSLLVRQELELARTEMRQKGKDRPPRASG